MTRKQIVVDALARVEGEGGLRIRLRDHRPPEVMLRIYEPPRFFEGFLRGRSMHEIPDITARICGICPIAYQMSGASAIEDACEVTVSEPVRRLRRLMYCGEWIESHGLHVFMLHAPDFLGYADAIRMAADHREIVVDALRAKKVGNTLVAAIGGREIHPVSVRVGGFWRAPAKAGLEALRPELEWAAARVRELLPWLASLPVPDFERDYEFVALHHDEDYAIERGRIVSSRGLDIPVRDFLRVFSEQHVEHSNALHVVTAAEQAPYHVGPLARYNLNFAQLPQGIRAAAAEVGLVPPVRNPFRSLAVRAVEMLYACEEAIALIDTYEPPVPPCATVTPKAGTGHGATEAPRGMLYHRYRLDETGLVHDARIIPPTAQNLRCMEEDLAAYVPPRVDLPADRLTWECEQAVRNYDPCISCATHFLEVEVIRDGDAGG
ncbi:MAG: nickel-dependent hydrogenase large subunit [Vicinamibacteraceae bacterium]|nr:nickel-dependent hydrogenase large subunit [Vicinamibacteraceae bacterium]